jgi:hypothetical protein
MPMAGRVQVVDARRRRQQYSHNSIAPRIPIYDREGLADKPSSKFPCADRTIGLPAMVIAAPALTQLLLWQGGSIGALEDPLAAQALGGCVGHGLKPFALVERWRS